MKNANLYYAILAAMFAVWGLAGIAPNSWVGVCRLIFVGFVIRLLLSGVFWLRRKYWKTSK